LVAGALLASAWGMDWLLREGYLPADGYPRASQGWKEVLKAEYFEPLSPSVLGGGDMQPGWALWASGLAVGLAALRRRAVADQLLFGALILLLPLLLHWPGAGSFMFEYMPGPLVQMSGFTMDLRMMPIYSAMMAFAGLLFLRTSPQLIGAGRGRWVLGAALLLMLLWSAWQGRLFVLRGWVATTTAVIQAREWRSENAVMDRFVYDLLPAPSYFSHGKMDPRLEIRLLDDHGNLIYGPPQMVAAMEAAGSETIQLRAESYPGAPNWLQLAPGLVLQPGEHRLLRFEFDPARRYVGHLIMQSESNYREYLMPASGLSRAFGAGAEHSRVISLWNSGDTPQHYQLQFILSPGHDLAAGMPFATLTTCRYRPELAGFRLESLNPWRVQTNLPWSGQLETTRVFLPGYEVKVDGRRIGASRVSASPDRLLQIAMPPGQHTVEVRFVGSTKLRMAGVISLVAWIVLLGCLGFGGCRKSGWASF
jgi:hypothetical protein